MVPVVLFVVFSLVAVPAFAQSPYVGASVGMDIARFGGVEFPGFNDLNPNGEAVNFSLRVGTEVGNNWGVELGFTRPSEIERESNQGLPIPLLASAIGAGAISNIGVSLPTFAVTSRIELRNTTIDAVAWVSQRLGDSVDLVYLGGVAFNRTVQTIGFGGSGPRLAAVILPASTRTTMYGVGPLAGVDARIDLTEHIRLVPGIRLQTVGGNGMEGWLVRPSAGLDWVF
jgi:hypothetical protein